MRKVMLATLSILFLCTVACSLKPIAMEQVASYEINTLSTSQTRTTSSNKTLLVSLTTANPGFQSSDLIYVKKTHQLSAYTKSRWVSPPADMVNRAIVQNLEKTNHYKAVVGQPFTGFSDYRLDSQLVTLQQEFFNHTSQVRLILNAQIIDSKTNKVIASKRFEALEYAPEETPYGGVIAANQATQDIL